MLKLHRLFLYQDLINKVENNLFKKLLKELMMKITIKNIIILSFFQKELQAMAIQS